jgi:hypothetical protein
MQINPKHLAEAYVAVAVVDHYLVVVATAAAADLEQAKQILICLDNAVNNENRLISRALDLIEMDIRNLERAASRGET